MIGRGIVAVHQFGLAEMNRLAEWRVPVSFATPTFGDAALKTAGAWARGGVILPMVRPGVPFFSWRQTPVCRYGGGGNPFEMTMTNSIPQDGAAAKSFATQKAGGLLIYWHESSLP
jgi:hypothetical protein